MFLRIICQFWVHIFDYTLDHKFIIDTLFQIETSKDLITYNHAFHLKTFVVSLTLTDIVFSFKLLIQTLANLLNVNLFLPLPVQSVCCVLMWTCRPLLAKVSHVGRHVWPSTNVFSVPQLEGRPCLQRSDPQTQTRSHQLRQPQKGVMRTHLSLLWGNPTELVFWRCCCSLGWSCDQSKQCFWSGWEAPWYP